MNTRASTLTQEEAAASGMVVSLRQMLAGIYEVSNVNNPHRNLPMEGLRGFAVILVFFVHYHALFRFWIDDRSRSFAVSFFWRT